LRDTFRGAIQRPRSKRGQALVEAALVLPVLIMLLLLAIDFGRIFFTSIDLRNAAHEATMYAGTRPAADCVLDLKVVVDREMGRSDTICGAMGTSAGLVYITVAECEHADVDPPCAPWAPPYPPTSRLRYVVRLQYRFQPVMPLVGLLTGNGLGGSLPMTVENRSPILVGYGGSE
jgi:TadE-like protein